MLQAEVQLHSFSNGTSTATKTDNWQQIQKICSQQSLPLPAQLMQETAKVYHVLLLLHSFPLDQVT